MARHKAHRVRSDTPQRKSSLVTLMREGVALPTGCALSSDEERALWDIYTQARVPDDWRAVDLLALHKVIRLESQLQEELRLIAQEGYMTEGKHGQRTCNPRLRIVCSLQAMQLQLMRTLKIYSLPDSQSAMASRARQAKALYSTVDRVGSDLLSGR